MASSRHVDFKQWGVGASLARPPTRPVLRDLLEALDPAKTSFQHASSQHLARQISYAELCPRNGLRNAEIKRLNDLCSEMANSAIGERWPRFVARSLREQNLPELASFLRVVTEKEMHPNGYETWRVVTPSDLDVVNCAEDAPGLERQYSVQEKAADGDRFLAELLGEKAAASIKPRSDGDGYQPQRKSLPTPGAGTSRRLGRSNRPTMNDQNKMIGKPATGEKYKSVGNGLSAKAAMERIKLNQKRKTIEVLGSDELPPAPDTLHALTTRRQKREKEREEQQKVKRAKLIEKKRREKEREIEERERKLALREKFREDRKRVVVRRSSRLNTTIGEDLDAFPGDDVDDSEIDEEFDNDMDDENDYEYNPENKHDRVPRRNVTPGDKARSGEEAWRARARISNKNSQIYEMESTLRKPRYDAQDRERNARNTSEPSVTTSAFTSTPFNLSQRMTKMQVEDESNFDTEAFARAVGEYRNNLSNRDILFLRDFFGNQINSLSEIGEDGKEFVLHETESESLILRLQPDGGWNRLRVSNE